MAGPPPLGADTTHTHTHKTRVTQNETLCYLTVSYMSLLYLVDCDLLIVEDFRHSTSLSDLMPKKTFPTDRRLWITLEEHKAS